jgi:hypothetical protein
MTDVSVPQAPVTKILPNYIKTADLTEISTGPGTIWSVIAYTTSTGDISAAIPGYVRTYDQPFDSITPGMDVTASWPIAVVGTSTVGPIVVGTPHSDFEVGIVFRTACSIDASVNTTTTGVLANAKLTVLFST